MILEIVMDPNPVLRQIAKPISKVTKGLEELAKNMLETMYEANGAGLAAPQVGISKRIIVIDVGEGPIVLFNPEIVSSSGSYIDYEGCLSIPGLTGKVDRAQTVTVKGITLGGKAVEYNGKDMLAKAFQHEIDHLDGILFTDKATDLEEQKDEE